MSEDQMLESAMRCLDRALDAMNRAVEMTADKGPAVAMEFIADFLNDTDGIDEDVADAVPDNWLDRWQVTGRMNTADRGALIAVIEALYLGAAEHHWAEAGWLAESLGWPEADSLPHNTWVRARLNEATR